MATATASRLTSVSAVCCACKKKKKERKKCVCSKTEPLLRNHTSVRGWNLVLGSGPGTVYVMLVSYPRVSSSFICV